LTLSDDHEVLVLTLADNGVGIPPDKHIQAISRFSQAGAGQGSGLGLPIASKVIGNHNGLLKINDVPIGTSIEIRLPKAQLTCAVENG
ncbi:ATP-binding protein, partial [Litoreibacter halocynthiae]|uniref:ATP-binding protein n=1 Tax=Litoreibacter halocynthiae TaxID=1242689 RepID=UPI002492094A